MAFIIDTINGSGLYAQSAASASVATYDSNGNVITATYLTGVDLTPYQTTADMVNYQAVSGMTAYATTGDVANKLDTTAFSDVSGTFLTAHQSLYGYATTAWVDSQGYLTAHQPISADEWNNVYDTVNVYSGSWTGSESSPTASVDSYGSIDIVSSNNTVYFDVNGTWFNDAVNSALPTSATQWNRNYETVNTNSGVWGGSALPISAGPGIKVDLVDNTLVFSNDETVLWSGDAVITATSGINTNEPYTNFERLQFYGRTYFDQYERMYGEMLSNNSTGYLPLFLTYPNGANDTLRLASFQIQTTADDATKFIISKGKLWNLSNTSVSTGTPTMTLTRVIGINRIQ